MAYLLLPILLILMYLMLLRPQQQRLRAQRQVVASLDVGDDIVTAGGIIGRIVALTDERASVEVADGVVIDFLRAAISRKAPEDGSRDFDLRDESDEDLDDLDGTDGHEAENLHAEDHHAEDHHSDDHHAEDLHAETAGPTADGADRKDEESR